MTKIAPYPVLLMALAGLTCIGTTNASERLPSPVRQALDRPFELPGTRVAQRQNYEIKVDMTIQTPNVDRQKRASYVLGLECNPSIGDSPTSTGQTVTYTCRRFAIQKEGGDESTIPSLKDWSYEFTYPSQDVAPNGNVFGLPNSKFQGLTDNTGSKLDAQMEFLVYNAFTDYHVLCNVYAQEMNGNSGIQALRKVGDRVLHGTSNSRAPLGNVPGLSEGSEFVHGDVTLEFKGIGQDRGRPCALIGFDAGENTFKMVIEPAPNYTVISQGKSHHTGDLYIDLRSGWVVKAQMTETVISWVNVGGKQTGPSVVRRLLQLRTK